MDKKHVEPNGVLKENEYNAGQNIRRTESSGINMVSPDVKFDEQNGFFLRNKSKMKITRNFLALTLYLGYFGYAMYCEFGDDESIQLTVFTGFGLAYITWNKAMGFERSVKGWKFLLDTIQSAYSNGNRPKFIRWFLNISFSLLFIAYVVIYVAIKKPERLISLGGFVSFVIVMMLLSNNRRKINWHTVFWGTAIQFLIGYFILNSQAGKTILLWMSDRLEGFLSYSDVGSRFVFGAAYMDHPIAMQALPSVIVFCAVIEVLIYLGVIQVIVRTFGKFLAVILDVSAPEATNACANIFLSGTESLVLLCEYITNIPMSGIFALMTNATASCSGVALIQFMAFGVPPNYLLAASAMSAPAALVCAKLMYPDTDQIKTEDISLAVFHEKDQTSTDEKTDNGSKKDIFTIDIESKDIYTPVNENEEKRQVDNEKTAFQRSEEPKNIGEAIVKGTRLGTKLVVTLVSLVIVALALTEFVNKTVEWLGARVNVHIDLYIILSYVFYPFVYVMGVDRSDCLRAGRLLGVRTISSPMIAYAQLADFISNRQQLEAYVATLNETFVFESDSDIFLPGLNETLTGGVLTERSELIITYALCGFASVPFIVMTIGVMIAVIPQRAPEITGLAFKGTLAGTFASYLTACVAGLLS